jgi:ATP-dependent DNA helicase RecG
MKEQELSEVWRQMIAQEVDVLVCTTIIETGVDLPNANTVIIDNADRMGLSQLHQLRGRVGRGEAQSFCVLISDRLSSVTRQRLEVMCATNDGFVIADEDLKLRGPGDFFGERQHGLPQLAIADFADTRSIELSQKIADYILSVYRDLRNEELRLLKAEIERLFDRGGHNTMN